MVEVITSSKPQYRLSTSSHWPQVSVVVRLQDFLMVAYPTPVHCIMQECLSHLHAFCQEHGWQVLTFGRCTWPLGLALAYNGLNFSGQVSTFRQVLQTTIFTHISQISPDEVTVIASKDDLKHMFMSGSLLKYCMPTSTN